MRFIIYLGMFISLLFTTSQGCSRKSVCQNGVSSSTLDPNASPCESDCDCNNQLYEGICSSKVCLSRARAQCPTKGQTERCVHFVSQCAGQRICQPDELTQLAWGNCQCDAKEPIKEAPAPERTKEAAKEAPPEPDAGPKEPEPTRELPPEPLREQAKEAENTPEPGCLKGNGHCCTLIHTLKNDSNGKIGAIAFSNKGDIFVSGDSTGFVKQWELTTGTPTTFGTQQDWHSSAVSALAFSHDDTLLYSSSEDRTIRIWDPKNKKFTSFMQEHTNFVTGLSAHPKRFEIATISIDETIKFWDTKTEKVLKSQLTKPLTEKHITTSPDGNTVVTTGGGPEITLWDANTHLKLSSLDKKHTDIVQQTAFSPKGDLLVSVSNDKSIKLWQWSNKSVKTTLASNKTEEAHQQPIHAVTFHPKGTIFASGDAAGQIYLWDPNSATPLAILKEGTAPINNLRFSPDGRTLAAATQDGTKGAVLIWSCQ